MAADNTTFKAPVSKEYMRMQTLFCHYSTGKGFRLDSIQDMSVAVKEFCQNYNLMFKLVFDPVDNSWSGAFFTEMGDIKAMISDEEMERAIVFSLCATVNVLSKEGRLKS